MGERLFPVLWHEFEREGKALKAAGCPKSVPWGFVAEHEEQCQKNHDQSAARLAERGGLGVNEMVYVLRDEHWPRLDRMLSELDALPELKRRLAEWQARIALKETPDHG